MNPKTLTPTMTKPTCGGAESLLLGRAPPSPAASKTTRPQGGAVTEWYKGKTHVPIWRQISPEILPLSSFMVYQSRSLDAFDCR